MVKTLKFLYVMVLFLSLFLVTKNIDDNLFFYPFPL